MKMNFAKLVKNEFDVLPNHYVVETEDGTVLKVDEELSVGSVINFVDSQIVSKGEPKAIDDSNRVFQGFVKEIDKVKLEWDATTSIEDIYIAMMGNPIPVSLLAFLTSQALKQHV